MYVFLMVLHVFVCMVLILVILLQAGRGGGFSDMMGGGQPQSIFGTQTNAFMTRATEACAVLFIITSLSLAVLSTQRGKSLVEKEMLVRSLKTAIPPLPAAQSPQSATLPAKPTPSLEPVVATTPAVAPAPLPDEAKADNSTQQK